MPHAGFLRFHRTPDRPPTRYRPAAPTLGQPPSFRHRDAGPGRALTGSTSRSARGLIARPPWSEGALLAPRFGRLAKQVAWLDLERLGEFQKLEVRHPTDLGFKLGKRVSADVPAEEVEFGAKLRLSKTLFLADLAHHRTDDIARRSHCSEFGTSELDNGRSCGKVCAVFGTFLILCSYVVLE